MARVPLGAIGLAEAAEPIPWPKLLLVPAGAFGDRQAEPPATEEEHSRACGPHTIVWDSWGPSGGGGNARYKHVLGGWPAEAEVRRVLRGAIARGKLWVHYFDERERRGAYWRRIEAETDERFKNALSLSVIPMAEEDEDAYDRRLEAIFANLRGRLDEGARNLLLSPSASSRARPTIVGQTDPAPRAAPSPPPPPDLRDVFPTREERRAVNPDLYARLGRKPSADEVAEAVLRLRRVRG